MSSLLKTPELKIPANADYSGVLYGIEAPDRRIPCVGENNASWELELVFRPDDPADLKGSTIAD